MNRNTLLLIAKLLVSGGLITWILRRSDLAAIWQAIGNTNPWMLAFAFAMFYVGYLITAFRWRLLLRAQQIEARIPFLLTSFTVSVFFNNLMPSTIGGDAYRMYDVWRLGGNKARAFSIVLMDRFIGAMALITYGFLAVLVAPEIRDAIPGIVLYLGVMLAVMVGVVWMTFGSGGQLLDRFLALDHPLLRWPQKIIGALADGFRQFRGRGDILGKALGLSFLLQLNVIVHFILVAAAMGLAVPAAAMFIIIPMALLVMLMPISINGIGVREAVFVFFFSLYGVSTESAVAFAWVALAMLLAQGVIGGIVFMVRRWLPGQSLPDQSGVAEGDQAAKADS